MLGLDFDDSSNLRKVIQDSGTLQECEKHDQQFFSCLKEWQCLTEKMNCLLFFSKDECEQQVVVRNRNRSNRDFFQSTLQKLMCAAIEGTYKNINFVLASSSKHPGPDGGR